jgi:predicted AlkP superfamily phosphohydrolase/phosphomutase
MKTILVGFDAFDPIIFERLHNAGKTPNLNKIVEQGGYSRFNVSNPPQSEVSWTSIATGLNPGGHGIFDFVHRNPHTYSRQVSLLPSKSGIVGRQFIPPFTASTIFNAAVDDGYPATSLWWPATFPARQDSPVSTLPGLGTPDIYGRLGVGISYSLEQADESKKTRVELLSDIGRGRFTGMITGPQKPSMRGMKASSLNFELWINDDHTGQLIINNKRISLKLGEWSPVVELPFKVGLGIVIKAVTRIILTKIKPFPSIYFLPLQLHPLHSPWPYGTPKKMMKSIWNKYGPYLTLGWPQDTTGLEEGFIDDNQFLKLCDDICRNRENTFLSMIENFNEGVLACVFDSLDRIQHMFYRDRMYIVESWYIKLDQLFGRVLNKVEEKPDHDDIQILVVSDHGFGPFKYRVSLNNFLIEKEYLKPEDPGDVGNLNQVIWHETRAYAVGLNSLYLNQEGREGEGIIKDDKSPLLLQQIKNDLTSWIGPDGKHVINNVRTNAEAFTGPYSEYGPDLVIGYNSGYRASSETGMGEWGNSSIEENLDHWGSDHCIDSDLVPGVLFLNRGMNNLNHPSYKDIPFLVVNKEIKQSGRTTGPTFSEEDQDILDERLKELGYL